MSVTPEVSVVNAAIALLAADTTLTAIVPAARIDQMRGPIRLLDVTDQLYIVVTPDTQGQPEHTQRSDGFHCTFVVIVVDRAANGLANIAAAAERIFGDANKLIANNGAPTYGLHKKNLTLGGDANGWLANTIMSQGAFWDGTDDLIFRSEKFTVQTSRVPA